MYQQMPKTLTTIENKHTRTSIDEKTKARAEKELEDWETNDAKILTRILNPFNHQPMCIWPDF